MLSDAEPAEEKKYKKVKLFQKKKKTQKTFFQVFAFYFFLLHKKIDFSRKLRPIRGHCDKTFYVRNFCNKLECLSLVSTKIRKLQTKKLYNIDPRSSNCFFSRLSFRTSKLECLLLKTF